MVATHIDFLTIFHLFTRLSPPSQYSSKPNNHHASWAFVNKLALGMATQCSERAEHCNPHRENMEQFPYWLCQGQPMQCTTGCCCVLLYVQFSIAYVLCCSHWTLLPVWKRVRERYCARKCRNTMQKEEKKVHKVLLELRRWERSWQTFQAGKLQASGGRRMVFERLWSTI